MRSQLFSDDPLDDLRHERHIRNWFITLWLLLISSRWAWQKAAFWLVGRTPSLNDVLHIIQQNIDRYIVGRANMSSVVNWGGVSVSCRQCTVYRRWRSLSVCGLLIADEQRKTLKIPNCVCAKLFTHAWVNGRDDIVLSTRFVVRENDSLDCCASRVISSSCCMLHDMLHAQ